MEITLIKEKETPGTWRYKENKEDHPMTIYLTKEQVKELGNPQTIKMTITVAQTNCQSVKGIISVIALLVIGILGLIGCTVMLIASAKNKKTIRYRAIGLTGIVVSFILIMMGAVGSFGTPKSPSSTVAPSDSSVCSHKIESLNQV